MLNLQEITWNQFREHYSSFSFHDVEVINAFWDDKWPNQKRFKGWLFKQMFSMIPPDVTVLEVGCHNGLLAELILKGFPEIVKWYGYDFKKVLSRHIVSDNRFVARDLNTWFHGSDLPPADVLVASHVLEHLSNKQAIETLSLGHKYIMHETPVLEKKQDWHNYMGGHVLYMGQSDIDEFLTSIGYSVLFSNVKYGVFLYCLEGAK